MSRRQARSAGTAVNYRPVVTVNELPVDIVQTVDVADDRSATADRTDEHTGTGDHTDGPMVRKSSGCDMSKICRWARQIRALIDRYVFERGECS